MKKIEERRLARQTEVIFPRVALEHPPIASRPTHRDQGLQSAQPVASLTAKRSLGMTSILVMIALALTKLTGQLRQIFIGLKFGYDTPYADGFTQGFLIPDFVYALLIGGAIQAAIIPFLSGEIEQNREREGWRALSSLITGMALLLATVLLVCELIVPWLLRPFTTATSYAIAVSSARALLPQAFFMMLAALLIGVLNTYKHFVATALTPCFYNLAVLAALIFLAKPEANAVVLTSWGITGGAMAYFALQLWLSRKHLTYFRPRLGFGDPQVVELLKLALPTLLASAIPYLSSFWISAYYPRFADGTSYAYANAVSTWQLPFGVVVIALTNILLPHLSEACVRRDYLKARQAYSSALRTALLLITPAAVTFFMLSEEVIQAIFQWGQALSPESLQFTASLLKCYCVVLVTNTLIYFLNNLFYANRMTWIPLLGSAVVLIGLAAFSEAFIQWTNLGASAMAAGFAGGSLLALGLLIVWRHKVLPQISGWPGWRFILILVIGGGIAAIGLALLQVGTQGWQPASKLAQLVYLGCKTAAVYLVVWLTGWIFKAPECRTWLIRGGERLKQNG